MSATSPEAISASSRDAFAQPISIVPGNGRAAFLKIDALIMDNGLCAVGGWQSEPFEMSIVKNGAEVRLLGFSRFSRADVNAYLGTPSAMRHGFALAFACDAQMPYSLAAGSELFVIDLEKAESGLKPGIESLVGEEIAALLRPGSGDEQTKQKESAAIQAKCGLDCALRWPDGTLGNPVIVSGWLASPPGLSICAGDGQSAYVPAMRYFSRPDIAKDYDLFVSSASHGHGFVFVLKDYPVQNDRIAIYAGKDGMKAKVAEIETRTFHSFRSFLKAVFEIDVPASELANIYSETLLPLLTEIQRKRVREIMAGKHVPGIIGKPSANPAMSVIVPLYGSLDLLETQLQRFAWDPEFQNQAELVYVVSDPALLERFTSEIARLCRTYGIGCRWVHVHASLGFAEACNLGAAIAKGEYLVFANSDVYPLRPGWLRMFREFLAKTPQAGVAGCRLVYPDGLPQHCGARLRHDSRLNIRECVHLLDDAADSPEIMPYVTGACIAMRRRDFDAVKGFSSEYLIGNYEDLDLCDKLRALGKEIWYLPMITMIHVWHQAFKSMEQGKWLERLAVYNGVVFVGKWMND